MSIMTTFELTDKALTAKQTEVLELLLDHISTKQIARMLKISPSAVDQRIYSSAGKLGELDRWQVARKYAVMRQSCKYHTCEFSQVPSSAEPSHSPLPKVGAPDHFVFHDTSTYHDNAPTTEGRRLPFLDKLDDRVDHFVIGRGQIVSMRLAGLL